MEYENKTLTLQINKQIRELLNECKREKVRHHKELQNVVISDLKIIGDIAEFYLRN